MPPAGFSQATEEEKGWVVKAVLEALARVYEAHLRLPPVLPKLPYFGTTDVPPIYLGECSRRTLDETWAGRIMHEVMTAANGARARWKRPGAPLGSRDHAYNALILQLARQHECRLEDAADFARLAKEYGVRLRGGVSPSAPPVEAADPATDGADAATDGADAAAGVHTRADAAEELLMLALQELDPARLRRLAGRLDLDQRERMLQTVVALAGADDEQLAGTFTRGLGAEARATLVGHLIRDEETRAVLERRRKAGAAGAGASASAAGASTAGAEADASASAAADAIASAAARQECEVRLPALRAVDALQLLVAIGGAVLADGEGGERLLPEGVDGQIFVLLVRALRRVHEHRDDDGKRIQDFISTTLQAVGRSRMALGSFTTWLMWCATRPFDDAHWGKPDNNIKFRRVVPDFYLEVFENLAFVGGDHVIEMLRGPGHSNRILAGRDRRGRHRMSDYTLREQRERFLLHGVPCARSLRPRVKKEVSLETLIAESTRALVNTWKLKEQPDGSGRALAAACAATDRAAAAAAEARAAASLPPLPEPAPEPAWQPDLEGMRLWRRGTTSPDFLPPRAEPRRSEQSTARAAGPTPEDYEALDRVTLADMSEGGLASATLSDLKVYCRHAGLRVGGKKSELVERVRDEIDKTSAYEPSRRRSVRQCHSEYRVA